MVLVAACGVILWAALALRDWFAPVHGWSRQVRDGSIEQRREAVGMLGTLTGRDVPAALPALIAALRDEDEQVAAIAAVSLGLAAQAAMRQGNPAAARDAVEALVAAIRDPRPGVATTVSGGLTAAGPGRLGSDAVARWIEALAEALNDRSVEVRTAAARSLAELGKASSAPPPAALLATLKCDSSPQVRAAAAWALGQYRSGHDPITVALLQALETDQPEVRRASDSALARLHELRTPGEKPRSAAIIPTLIEALASPEPLARNRAAAILGEIGPEASASIPALITLLNRPDEPGSLRIFGGGWDSTGNAAMALGAIAPATPEAKPVVAALIAVLDTPTFDDRREAAAEALVRFDRTLTAPALPRLLELLNESVGKPGSLAATMCHVTGQLAPGTPCADQAVGALTGALDSASGDTRTFAAQALARFGPQARPALPRLRAIEKRDRLPDVRKVAAFAVDQIEESVASDIAR